MSASLSNSPTPSLGRERGAESPADKSAFKRSSTDVEATVTLVQDAKHDVFDGEEMFAVHGDDDRVPDLRHEDLMEK